MAATEKYWTAGMLRGRGWTGQLIGQLLGAPRWANVNGRRVRVWPRARVLEAERSEAFRAAAAARARLQQQQEAVARQDVEGALRQAAAQLQAAWEAAPRSDDPASLLAGHYHRAIVRRIPAAAWADRLRPVQARGCVERFLALEAGGAEDRLGKTFRQFVTAAPWLGRGGGGSEVIRQLLTRYPAVLLAAAQRTVEAFSRAQPEADLHALLSMPRFPAEELLSHPLGYIYSVHYVPRAIRTSLELLVALNPKDEYPQARAMRRRFVVHLGGTNTGKTYAGLQRLIAAPTGVYLAPLRLLALEAQELLLDADVACSLTTGEEEDCHPDDTHVSATAEKLDLGRRYDVAVIDECQMISDRQRGYAWTRAILGVLAPEIHLCAAPQARDLLLRLIVSCGDTYEVVWHERKTPLVCMRRTVSLDQAQPGDALITFSKVGVLSVAEQLRRQGLEPAIIYGALPYSTRRQQMEGFLSGRMRCVVSTDAIGMGLNLPIRRIVFLETDKYDGVEKRQLLPEEIQQIAGRAGRYGMYDCGYVSAAENLELIRTALETQVAPLTYAVVGFSDLMLSVDFDLLEVLEVWNRMPTVAPYRRLDISRYLSLISQMRERGFRLSRQQELRAANIPFDETEEPLRELFYRFLSAWRHRQPLERPELPEKNETQYTLPELELYCRMLDLYYSFSKAFGCPVDLDALYDERERTAERINRILLHNLKNNIRFCSQCGAALPLYHSGRLCPACARRQGQGRSGGTRAARR